MFIEAKTLFYLVDRAREARRHGSVLKPFSTPQFSRPLRLFNLYSVLCSKRSASCVSTVALPGQLTKNEMRSDEIRLSKVILFIGHLPCQSEEWFPIPTPI